MKTSAIGARTADGACATSQPCQPVTAAQPLSRRVILSSDERFMPMSRTGGAPNTRCYSLLNWDGLSYPIRCPAEPRAASGGWTARLDRTK